MSVHRIDLSDQKLLEFYRKFQSERHSLGDVFPQVRYDAFIDSGSYDATAIPVPFIASDQLLKITNAVNRFLYNTYGLCAWNRILSSLDEDEKAQVLLEFVFPLVSLSLSAPYSIKQMLIISVYQTSFYTNRFKTQDQRKFKPKANFKDAEEAAKNFSAWPTLYTALAELSTESFIQASDNFRNRLNHGFPRNVELGFRFVVSPTNADHTEYRIGEETPLQIESLLPNIEREYHAAVAAHAAYVGLLKEQERLWPHPRSSLASSK